MAAGKVQSGEIMTANQKRLVLWAVFGLVGFGLYRIAAAPEESPAPLAWNSQGAYNAASVVKLAGRVEAAGYRCDGRGARRLGPVAGEVVSVISCDGAGFLHIERREGGVAIVPCEAAAASGLSCRALDLLTN